jgi:hypothetical protein
MTPAHRIVRRVLAAVIAIAAALLAACAGTPVPDWQVEAHGAVERATSAYLEGNSRVADAEFARARAAVARTGRVDLMARVELSRCAAQLASLQLDPCTGFERLRADAAPTELAYADYLAGKVSTAQIPLLPPQHQALAASTGDAGRDFTTLQDMKDPLARLVGAAVCLRGARTSPQMMNLVAETASAQGWSRPLLGWLGALQLRARQAGDQTEAERIGRRIELVTSPSPAK